MRWRLEPDALHQSAEGYAFRLTNDGSRPALRVFLEPPRVAQQRGNVPYGQTINPGSAAEAFGWGPDVKLRVPPEDTAELRDLLDKGGVPYSTGAEFSQGPVVDLLAAVVEQKAAWGALGGVITAYLARNATRSVQVGDIVVKGHGRDDSLRIIEALQARKQESDDPQTASDQGE